MQVCKSRFVEKVRAQDPRVIDLSRHRLARVPARHTWCVRAAHGVLWVVVVEAINVEAEHQRLARRELLVEPSVKEKLAVVTRIVQMTIRRQYKGRERR